MTKLVMLLLTLTPLMLGPQAATAQDAFRVGPTLLRADGRTTPGVRMTWRTDNHQVRLGERLPRAWSWGSGLNLPVTWDAHRNPESLRGELRAGAFISLYNPPTPPPGPLDPEERYGAWNYGFLSMEARVGVEAPQRLDRGDLLLGVLLRYEHDQYQALWFLPELRFTADRGYCAGCDPPPGESVDRSFTRLEAEASWSVPLDRRWTPESLRPLWLRSEGRAFRFRGLPTGLVEGRPVDGVWANVELAYRLDRSRWLHEVYVRWSDGEVPVLVENRRAWGVGATVSF